MNKAQIHSELLERLPDVDDSFLEEHRDVLLAAIGEIPGVDSVRAAVVHLLPRLVTEPLQLDAYLQQAAKALRTYPDAVASGDPVSLMARHPAWVGLAHLEVSEALGGDPEDALSVAVQHARLGFTAAAGPGVEEGEVLWAMAETAEEAGWTDRSDALLDRATGAPFMEAVARAQVLLLAGQRAASAAPERAVELLQSVIEEDVPHPVRVQAAFVLGRVAESSGDLESARKWLERALEMVDDEDDPSVAARLQSELERFGR